MPTQLSGIYRETYRNGDWSVGYLTTDNGSYHNLRLTYPEGLVVESLDDQRIVVIADRQDWKGREQWVAQHVALANEKEALSKSLIAAKVKGLGEKRSHLIIMKWGRDFINHFTVDELSQLHGISRKVAITAVADWQEKRQAFVMAIAAANLGMTLGNARRAFHHFGPELERIIEENPYRLMEVPGIGFQAADAVGKKKGFQPDCPERTNAATDHVLLEHAKLGHTAMDKASAWMGVTKLTNITNPNKWIYTAPEYEGMLAELQTYNRETTIAERLLALNKRLYTKPIVIPDFLTPDQVAALQLVLDNQVSILTGPPGSGKTTVLSIIIDNLQQMGLRVTCLAPTGRAARHLTSVSGMPASTIHKWLGSIDEDVSDAIVIDETSMLGTTLAARLMMAVDNQRLIFVGDAFQLPPVEPGQVLRDMILAQLPTARLTSIMRQDEQSGIVVNAINLREQRPIITDGFADFRWIEHNLEADPVSVLVGEIEAGRIPRDTWVLAALRAQVAELNERLQALLNPNEERIQFWGNKFSLNDKVRQTTNNYQLNVMNGEIGVITWIAKEGLEVEFEDRVVAYDHDEAAELTLAYALTIHSSQGGEKDNVALIMPWLQWENRRKTWLTRELPYTGITRAKKHITVIGDKRSRDYYQTAVGFTNRTTLLGRMLRKKLI